MWYFGGGAVIMAVVCGALLAAAQPQLGQHMEEDSSVNAQMLECYARYTRTAHEPGVLLVHYDYADVGRYAASIRAPLTILNMGYLKTKKGFFVPSSLVRVLQCFYSLVVVLVQAKEEFRIYKQLLRHDIYEDARSRYLAVCMEPGFGVLARGIINVASRYSLYNVAVLTTNDTLVHSCFPPGGTVCRKPWPCKVLDRCQQLSFDQLYVQPETIDYAGCHVVLSMPYPPPCALDHKSHSEHPLVAGYEVALANVVTKRLHMVITVVDNYLKKPCSSAYPYYTDILRWYVPVAGPRAQWKSVVLVFQAPLWAAVLAFFLLNTLAWWLVGTGGYVQCVLGSLRTLLNDAVPLPQHTSRRFLVVSWTLCALVLGAAYQSQLLSTLLTPVAEHQPISNEQELFASDMPVDLSSVGKEINNMRSYKQIKAHERKFKIDPDKPRAVLQYDVTAKYRAQQQLDARGKRTLYAFEQPAMYVLMCVKLGTYTSKVHPVNRMVRRLMENGIVAKFMRDVDFSGYVAGGGHEDEPLTMRHLDFAFVALLLGCALATLTLLLEVVGWRTQHEWWPAFCTVVRRCGSRIQDWWRTVTSGIRRWRRRARFLRRRRAFRRRVLA